MCRVHGSVMSVRRRLPVLLVCCCLTAYFGFHAIHGKHGLEARWALKSRAVALTAELRSLEVARAQLEREVRLLAIDQAEAAFVEEIARSLLGYARRGDRIVLPGAQRQARLQ